LFFLCVIEKSTVESEILCHNFFNCPIQTGRMNSETYNMLALGGLLLGKLIWLSINSYHIYIFFIFYIWNLNWHFLGKLILLSILICYCCKTRRKNVVPGAEVADSADQTDVTGYFTSYLTIPDIDFLFSWTIHYFYCYPNK
jgi:hypothetical protein